MKKWNKKIDNAREEKISPILFFLTALIFLNINGALALYFGTLGLATPLFAVFSLFMAVVGLTKTRVITSKEFLTYVAFWIFYLVIGWLASLFFYNTWSKIQILFSVATNLLIVFSYACAIRGSRISSNLIFLIRIMAIVMSLLIIFSQNYLDKYGIYVEGQESRNAGLFGNPNTAASYCCLALVLALSDARTGIVIALAEISCYLMAIFVTYSKGGIITAMILVIATLLLSVFFTKNRERLITLKSMILTCIVAIGLLGVISSAYQYLPIDAEQERRMDQLRTLFVSGALNDEVTTNRTGTLEAAIQDWSVSPLLGIGLGAMHIVRGYEWGVHNTFMLILGEAGVVPLIIWIGMLLYAIRWGIKNVDRQEGRIVFGYIVVLVISCTSSHNVLEDRFHNAMIGMCMGFIINSRVLLNSNSK